MSSIFSKPKMAPVPVAPKDNSAEIAQARAEEQNRLRRNKGRSASLLGGSTGEQTGAPKRLLGA